MASTEALRDNFGLSQQEIAYFIGASRFQVADHKGTGRGFPDELEQVLKRIVLFYQHYKDKTVLYFT